MTGPALALLFTMLEPPAAPTAEQAAFFESKIRPVLVEQCGKCHGATGTKGGLRLDSRAAMLTGGDTGPGLVPGDAAKGTLLEAIRYTNSDMQMPPKGKLPDAVVRDFETWVKGGAPWPDPASESAPAVGAKPAFDLAARRASHWAWQPPRRVAPPTVADASWPRDAIDRFVLAKLDAAGLRPAPDAGKLVWLRRATFAATGLPPTPAEQAAFEADDTPQARARVVDRLLASPHYGERWGRHWLDLARYAESRGHEFDYTIPNAFQYRDYVVRALNQDVPYDQFVREHLAGDVLPTPRTDPATGGDESVAATGFWHLGEEVHSPVDLRQDQCDRLDNRIDVFGKAFLGLTVACARCHDHKFDAISAADYAATFGLLQGGAYRQVRLDHRAESRELAGELAALCDRVSAHAPPLDIKPEPELEAWKAGAVALLDAANLAPAEWLPDDVTYGSGPRPAGSLARAADGTWFAEPRATVAYDSFWAGRTAAPGTEAEPHALKRRPPPGSAFRTRTAPLSGRFVHALVRGKGTAFAAVCGHTILDGPLHGKLLQEFDTPERQYRWVTFDLAEYKSWPLHLEFSATLGSDFAVAIVVVADSPPPKLAPAPEVAADLPGELRTQFGAEFAALRARVPKQSRLAPALWDGPSVDESVFVRGNPRAPGPVAPRRNLAALGGKPIAPKLGNGRLELALELTDPARNPLLARVAVNRAWHHIFGRGIVATVDNFGALGENPTHPELLDALALDFAADGFSTKRLLRRLLLSRTFGMSSDATALSNERDPGNLLLSRARVRRLEGEAIRDALLSASGRLDPKVGGPGVGIELTAFQDGRGKPKSGPRDGAGRRSLYLSARRNFLSPLLLAFDTPIPATSVGRRQASNVPAQALILMNDPFVRGESDRLAARVCAEADGAPARVELLYRLALGRPPTAAEVAACAAYLEGAGGEGWADLAHSLVQAKEFSYVR